MYDDGREETQEHAPLAAYDEPGQYEEPDPYAEGAYGAPEAPRARRPEVISTSQAVNLTGTLASLSALFALFLCFADQRSRAVRRFSVQSVGLGAAHLAIGLACWILSALLGWVPVIGYLIYILMAAALIGASAVILVLRVQMMLHAYRGEAYALPVIGQALRRYE